MIDAILFTVSAVVFGKFALHYWRAMISRVAAQGISDRIRRATGITAPEIGARDFRSVLSLYDLTQGLRGPNGGFLIVRAYYSVVETIGSLIPTMSNWANIEKATCSRYVAVLVDQQLQSNMARAAQIRGI